MTTTTDPVCGRSTPDSPDSLYRRRDERRALLLHETIDEGSATDDPGRVDGPRRSVDLAHAKAGRT
jgi:hypothetical protein